MQVFDEEGSDVTPQPLYQADPGTTQNTISRLLVDECSVEQTTATGSFTMPFSRSVFGSSRISSQSIFESVTEEIEETFSKWDMPVSFPAEKGIEDAVKNEVTEDTLKQIAQVVVTETDSHSLLYMPTTFESVYADDAEAIIERNSWYAEVCRKQSDNQCLDQSMQTFNGPTKNKQLQSDGHVMVDAATAVFILDTFDSPEQEEIVDQVESLETKKMDSPESVKDSNRSAERSSSLVSSFSTVNASSSLKRVEAFGDNLTAQPDLELMMSEKFQHSVFVMERSILRNNFKTLLTACRQLPLLKDPDRREAEELSEEDTDISLSPALKYLWAFSSELTRGYSISCMAWNKKNPELLAVGYGEFDLRNLKPGLVLCWSLKNPVWPECTIHCGSTVTSLDFSVSSPGQLAVGMCDGSIAIFSVQNSHIETHLISTNECSNRHFGPVWQLKWNQQELSFTGEAKVESLVSVGADGKVIKWEVSSGGVKGSELMELKRINQTKRKDGVNTTETTTGCVFSALTPGLCFDFHPTDPSIYLVGTWEGPIHKCSCSNTQQVLRTYKKHVGPVNHISWCPLNPDLFLSCSSDWTIQLWKQDCLTPMLGFRSTHGAIWDIRWSPKWVSVFATVNEAHIEIWDLNSSCLVPVFVRPSAPGVKMTSLQFASQTDCLVVGDTDSQVTVYQLRNIGVKGI
ncbi:dynein axonemal intermediate chain 4 [Nematolebias whitei]|uniref:dynein axonemal intermediate chain 4 n=1 Tax=Nematolebias whitei TaxID=451745 RepID=UPI0018988605|nr:dynein axonemal intermediate chain 4 [Nematolebias whitei]